MTTTKRSKSEHPLISDLTEQYDEIVNIDDLTFDTDNVKLYGENNKEYFDGLTSSIDKNGLFNPPVVYHTNEVKSGHTRIRSAIALGHKTIPIKRSRVKQPPKGYRNMLALSSENQGRPTDIGRQYYQIKTLLEAYSKDNADMKVVGDFKEELLKLTICPATQMSHNMFTQLEELEKHRIGLFNRVIESNGSKLSPGKAHELMMIDRRKAKNPLPQSKALEDIVTSVDITRAVNRVNNVMNQFNNITALNSEGDDIRVFDNIQKNVKGGFVHELFTNAVAESIQHRTEETVKPRVSKAMRIEDIQFPDYNASIEVKTCLIKDGNKIQFTTRRIKTGYHLLLAMSPDYDYVYCSYGWLDESVWKKAYSGPSKIIINELQKVKLRNFAGELKKDGDKVYCMTSKLIDIK